MCSASNNNSDDVKGSDASSEPPSGESNKHSPSGAISLEPQHSHAISEGTDTSLIAVEMPPAEIAEIDLYQKREKIYTRAIEGFYQRIRMFTGWPLLIAYFFTPWFNWGDRQAILFDLSTRQFHILGLTFWPQDLSMLAWGMMIAAFGLFLVTAIAGRVWCGYTCPQTVWTSIYMWIEQKVEGTRNQRIKLDQQPWSLHKLGKKLLKHSMWLSVAAYTGFTFVGYFTPIDELGWDIYSLTLSGWAWFFIVFFTWTTYINAAWLREQVCMYMCPYARFQSVMFDSNTLIVSYDKNRGDPRGSRKRNADPKELGLGDCVDCELCVQVCPTGIDIRDGLQYECIGCAMCVDACNSVMEKLNYPKNLISYTTENALEGKPTQFIRGRVIGYSIAIIAVSCLLVFKLVTRDNFEAGVIRDRQQLAIEMGQYIENRYTIKISNKTQQTQQYVISVANPEKYQLIANTQFSVESGETFSVPTRVQALKENLPISSDISFIIRDSLNEEIVKTTSFLNLR